ncbi:hypothetical protein BNJ_00248 [Kaumoebavirus]|uniref:hypothetical protein n=1 Tax=Kaumoebavirus TaxID=1859492 RepID=UPI0009C1D8AA|nr:hypothetical protein BNJ_00248 [Kaumoebavirus]ARA72076.1 hypothetical protein BNJ_00248 [Kaumoebavirus]
MDQPINIFFGKWYKYYTKYAATLSATLLTVAFVLMLIDSDYYRAVRDSALFVTFFSLIVPQVTLTFAWIIKKDYESRAPYFRRE